MKYILIENLAVLACSIVGFLFGIDYLKPRRVLYAGMIVQGMICVALGRLFQCALLWTGGSLTEHFQVGSLGVMGAFSFFFSSNYGQIDSLVDGGDRGFMKYRVIALIGPLCVVSMLIPILLSPTGRAFKISSAVVCCAVGTACYFHVKHLMIPDVDYGVVRCLRGYNALAIALSVLSMWELISLAWGSKILFILSGVGLCGVSLALVPAMDKGVKKWQT
jgi:hypothetical protein